MLRIISLLQEKNHYLEKFYSLNETELVKFSLGNFDNLENFYNTRERILEIIKYLDAQLDQSNAAMEDLSQVAAEDRRQVIEAMRTKDEYVSHIIEQDLEVLA